MKKQIHPKKAYHTYSVRYPQCVNIEAGKWSHYEDLHIQKAVIRFLEETRPGFKSEDWNIDAYVHSNPDYFRVEYKHFTSIQPIFSSQISPLGIEGIPVFLSVFYVEAKENYVKNITILDKIKKEIKEWFWFLY